MIPIASISLFLSTEVPASPGAPKPSYRAGATIIIPDQAQPLVLNIDTPEEFMALCAMLQVPGQLFYNPTGHTIVKNA